MISQFDSTETYKTRALNALIAYNRNPSAYTLHERREIKAAYATAFPEGCNGKLPASIQVASKRIRQHKRIKRKEIKTLKP